MDEQIKPLTEEEKRQRLAELKERMAAKRAAKAKEEAKETIANEAIRRKAGKVRRLLSGCRNYMQLTESLRLQDLNTIREEMKQKELLKEAEKKRRGTLARNIRRAGTSLTV